MVIRQFTWKGEEWTVRPGEAIGVNGPPFHPGLVFISASGERHDLMVGVLRDLVVGAGLITASDQELGTLLERAVPETPA